MKVWEVVAALCLVAWAASTGALVQGCGAALPDVDNPQYLDDAAKLAKCRAEGRAGKSDAGADAGWDAYVACTKDAGLR